jgi:hypothetical protein
METIGEEPFPPSTEHLAAAVEACGHFVVLQSLCSLPEDHLGSRDLKMQ